MDHRRLLLQIPHETLHESPSGIGTSDFLSCRCHRSLIFSLLDRWSCCNSSCQGFLQPKKLMIHHGSSWFIMVHHNFPIFSHIFPIQKSFKSRSKVVQKSFKSPFGDCSAPSPSCRPRSTWDRNGRRRDNRRSERSGFTSTEREICKQLLFQSTWVKLEKKRPENVAGSEKWTYSTLEPCCNPNLYLKRFRN